MAAAHDAPRKPVVLDSAQVHAGQLLQRRSGLRPLDGNLRVVVAHVGDVQPAHAADRLPHPLHILLACACVDDDQPVILAQLVQHHIIDERPVRIQHRRVMCLPDLELAGIVHQQLLHRGQRVRPAQLNIAHVANVEDAHARSYGHVLGDEPLVLHRHIPSAEVHHLGLVRVVGGMQRGAAQRSRDDGADEIGHGCS